MKVLLIDNGTTLLEKLRRLIPGEEIVQKWKDFDLEEARQADLVILSGGSIKQLIGNESEFEKELELVCTTEKPLIGICFGCEVVAVAFGSTLKELSEQERGKKTITILDKNLGAQQVEVYECHKWVVDSLSDDLEVLAISDSGPEIIKHKSRPIYGFQFHPENIVEETGGDELFLKLLSQLQTR